MLLVPAALCARRRRPRAVHHAATSFDTTGAHRPPPGLLSTSTPPGRRQEAVPLLLALLVVAAVVVYRMVRASEVWLPPLPVRPERGRARIVLGDLDAVAPPPAPARVADGDPVAAGAARARLGSTAAPRAARPTRGARRHRPRAARRAAVAARCCRRRRAGAPPPSPAARPSRPLAASVGWAPVLPRRGRGSPRRAARARRMASPALGLVSSASASPTRQGLADLIRDPRRRARLHPDMTPGGARLALGLVLERVLRGLGSASPTASARAGHDDVAEDAAPAPKGPKPGRSSTTRTSSAERPEDRHLELTHNLRESMRDPVTGSCRRSRPAPPRTTSCRAGVPEARTAARASWSRRGEAQRLGINARRRRQRRLLRHRPAREIHTDYYSSASPRSSPSEDQGGGEDILAAIAEEIVDGTFP